jgi:acid phosphatase family membrane protein YuiD
MNLGNILQNHVLITALTGWILAQALKIPIDLIQNKHWNWALFFAAGGMPSSHSALVTSAAFAVGLHHGFDNPLFGLATAFAMIVVYDATGIRRQAGIQAQKINVMIEELLKGHPVSQEHLIEVLGHTPVEAIGGMLLGLAVAVGLWFMWH